MSSSGTPPPTNVHANVALLSDYVGTDYDAAVQDARSIATRAAGLLAANAGVLTIAATIAPSARDAGYAGRTAAWIAAVLAVLSILIAIVGALPRPKLAISITGLSDFLTPEKPSRHRTLTSSSHARCGGFASRGRRGAISTSLASSRS
jgi:hypothetical protein